MKCKGRKQFVPTQFTQMSIRAAGAALADHFVTYQADAELANAHLVGSYHVVVYQADADLTNALVLGTSIVMVGTLAARPAASVAGRIYIATDDNVFRDNSASWDQFEQRDFNRIGDPEIAFVGGPAGTHVALKHGEGLTSPGTWLEICMDNADATDVIPENFLYKGRTYRTKFGVAIDGTARAQRLEPMALNDADHVWIWHQEIDTARWIAKGGNARYDLASDSADTTIVGPNVANAYRGRTFRAKLSLDGTGALIFRRLDLTASAGAGVNADSGGIKHARAAYGAIAANSDVLVTVNWTTAFADANYTVVATAQDASTIHVVCTIASKLAGSVQIEVKCPQTGSTGGTVHLIAFHD